MYTTLKVSWFRKEIFKPWILPKNEQKPIRFYYSATCFHLIFGRNWGQQKDISKLAFVEKCYFNNNAFTHVDSQKQDFQMEKVKLV